MIEYVAKAGTVLGGVGMLLLAVAMIGDGLRLAASQTLRDALGRWTSTPLHGVVSGTLFGVLVQSCSTVTVATIGFVNSGLLSLFNALGVVFGANLGATATGWLIVFAGYGFSPEFVAYPLVGVGAIMHVFFRDERIKATGQAMAGLGLFFVSLAILSASFAGAAKLTALDWLTVGGVWGMALSIAAGIAGAALIHSSGAVTLILSAAVGGLVPLPSAVAMLIGVNVGATVPALLTALQGTPNGKRLASAYLAFNVVTAAGMAAVVAVATWAANGVTIPDDIVAHPALALAGFYTLFNAVGIVLFLPMTGRLATFLNDRFRTVEEDEAKPRYLDKAVIATPSIGIDALAREAARMGGIVRDAARSALSGSRDALPHVKGRRVAMRSLGIAIQECVRMLRRRGMAAHAGEAMPLVFRVVQYYEEVAVLAERALSQRLVLETRLPPAVLQSLHELYAAAVRRIVDADSRRPGFTLESLATESVAFLDRYHGIKEDILCLGANEEIAVGDLSATLDQISRVRRMVGQTTKAARYLYMLTEPAPSLPRIAGVAPIPASEDQPPV